MVGIGFWLANAIIMNDTDNLVNGDMVFTLYFAEISPSWLGCMNLLELYNIQVYA